MLRHQPVPGQSWNRKIIITPHPYADLSPRDCRRLVPVSVAVHSPQMGNRAGLRLDDGRTASVVLPLLKRHPSRHRNHVPHRQIQGHALLGGTPSQWETALRRRVQKRRRGHCPGFGTNHHRRRHQTTTTMPMIKIILFELTRILLGYASDKVGEFIRNKQRNGPRPPSLYEEEAEDPWSQPPPR